MSKKKEVHKIPCKHCPSAHFSPDPEAEDMQSWVKSGEEKAEDWVFPCAWRPWAICKGVADRLGYKGVGDE